MERTNKLPNQTNIKIREKKTKRRNKKNNDNITIHKKSFT
jgi:hypothetical protein